MYKLHNHDCVSFMNTLESNLIDLTVTSPPYDNLRSYNGNNELWNESVWKNVLSELFRITKDGGIVVWVVNDATIDGSESGTSFKQALFAMECGFKLHDTMIWEKQTFTATGALKTRYAQVFEYMFVFSKGKIKTFNPIKDRLTKGTRSKSGTIRQVDGTLKPISSLGKTYSDTTAQRFNVWRINTEVSNSNRFHPAQFPEPLASDHIISWSNEGDLVFDPFLGSGTTGKMAVLNNRRFIGCELDENYFKIAQERINNCMENTK